jgi:hypothetical protein
MLGWRSYIESRANPGRIDLMMRIGLTLLSRFFRRQ